MQPNIICLCAAPCYLKEMRLAAGKQCFAILAVLWSGNRGSHASFEHCQQSILQLQGIALAFTFGLHALPLGQLIDLKGLSQARLGCSTDGRTDRRSTKRIRSKAEHRPLPLQTSSSTR